MSIKRKISRIFSLFPVMIMLALAVFLNSCAYITGESPTTTGTISRWSWSLDDNGHSVIIDIETLQPVRDVTPEEAFGIIGTSQYSNYPVVIDVRTAEEYASGHIRGSLNIDYYSDTFKNELDKLDKNILYIVICRSGGRSAAARDIMEDMGFMHVINVTQGFSGWAAAGLPVVK